MKFRWKILISNLFLLAIAFSVSGFLLIQHSFERNRNREIDVALEENQFIQIALENELVYQIRRNEFEGLASLTEAAEAIAGNFSGSRSSFAVTDAARNIYYNGADYSEVRWELVESLSERGQKNYIVYRKDQTWYVETACSLNINNEFAFLFSRRDISTVFDDREQMLGFYALTASLVLIICSLINYLLALWLTMPIMHLNRTASVIASGSYFVRCVVRSDDEVGELGKTFNRMAEAVENHVNELIEEGRRKEDFVGNFTHEIKTPLTSIIGYADMIRSRNLPDETRILAANYIFNEGMRLETMSMKLFDLLLLNREEIELVPIRVPNLFEQIMESTEPMLSAKSITMEIDAKDVYILGEPDLLKTAFINMVDNWPRIRRKKPYTWRCGTLALAFRRKRFRRSRKRSIWSTNPDPGKAAAQALAWRSRTVS